MRNWIASSLLALSLVGLAPRAQAMGPVRRAAVAGVILLASATGHPSVASAVGHESNRPSNCAWVPHDKHGRVVRSVTWEQMKVLLAKRAGCWTF